MTVENNKYLKKKHRDETKISQFYEKKVIEKRIAILWSSVTVLQARGSELDSLSKLLIFYSELH